MRIKRVRVQGFRCLVDLEVRFDDVTTLIGPNGVGKSSLLRALDWFFNGTAKSGLLPSDLNPEAESGRIRVEVEFHKLTGADREALGGYAVPGVDRVLLWRTWTEESDTFSGNARVYADFAGVREAGAASAKRTAYNELRTTQPELELPAVTSAPQVDDAMKAWEASNPSKLEDAEVSTTTRFFGFMGDAKLAGLFDYVFVSADLRAAEEAEDSKSALIGRLLERAVDRSLISTEVEQLADGLNARQAELVEEHLKSDLDDLTHALNGEIAALTSGRKVGITASPAAVKVAPLQFVTKVLDGTVETTVAGQGHGFQRALILAALKLVATRGRQDETSGTMLLAVEEPELFQHPSQARTFARTLRQLAEDPAQEVQVVYATHSPLFIEPGAFHQIRRLRRVEVEAGRGTTEVSEGNRQSVIDSLDGIMTPGQAGKQIDKACPQQLSEAVFADAAILVEGETDKAVIEAVALHISRFSTSNAAVVDVSGKGSIPLCSAILGCLGIPSIIAVDSDGDKQQADLSEANAKQIESHKQAIRSNRRLLESVGAAPEDWPEEGLSGGSIAFFNPNLEAHLKREWPEWEEARAELVLEGTGYPGKHALTYSTAVEEAAGEPSTLLREIVAASVDLLS